MLASQLHAALCWQVFHLQMTLWKTASLYEPACVMEELGSIAYAVMTLGLLTNEKALSMLN